VGQYYFGQVITAWIDDGQGTTKDRPALVISLDEDLHFGCDLEVLAITKGIEDPCPSYHFIVHETHRADPTTGLRFPCVAKCNWYRKIERRKVTGRIGYLPDDLLDQIYRAFNALWSDDDFHDWQ
jgi:mRNA-degrading endonuclease toxin of MazEF toxin-antitoxin module